MLILVVVAVVAIAAVAAVLAYLAMGGTLAVPFTGRTVSFVKEEAPPEWRPPAGKVPVLIAARDIKAYTAVSRDDLWDAKKGEFAVAYLEPDTTAIRNLSDLRGRVLQRDKPRSFAFYEEDFYPKGTRPGLVAGIPSGMRAMRVELDKVRGLYGLHPGDRFDLVATQAMTGDGAAELRRMGGVVGERIALETSLQAEGRKAAVHVIVQNGIVVSPAQVVEIPVGTNSLTRGRVTATRPVQEVFIAVKPEEVGPLNAALAVDAELSAVARSGRPDDPKDSVTPDLVPKRPFDDASADGSGGGAALSLVETIGGSNRDIVPVPKPAAEKEKEKK